MTIAIAMPSRFEVPELKKVLSARVRLSSHQKISNVIELWKERAAGLGESKEVVEAIDATHIVDRLLAQALDEELAQWGGWARTPEQKAAQLKVLREVIEEQKSEDAKTRSALVAHKKSSK